MANALGYVTETRAGFEGVLALMNLTSPIRIGKNAEKAGDGQPDYRIFAAETATEIGGSWLRKAKASGRNHISITLADRQIGPDLCSKRTNKVPSLSLPDLGFSGNDRSRDFRAG